MPALRDFRRRIKSVKSTQKICKAMKAVATAKMARAQATVVAARPYARQLHEVLGRVASAARDVQNPLLTVREPKRVCYIVITADRGLCGGFNSNILRTAVKELSKWEEFKLVAVGRKCRNFFRFRDWERDAEFIGLGENIRFEQGQQIARFVINKYIAGEYDAVYMVYSKFVNMLVQQPTVVKLLPVEPPAEEAAEKAGGEEAAAPKKATVDYIFEPSAADVLDYLLPRYVENSVYHGLIESKASEQSARMMAMDAATKNAGEMIDRLTLQMNRLRQEGITKELLDIVGGAAALE
ncbi:ATP synthase F1 subunit gamma [Candidatus Desulforudis audaxviator]|uniref:ATP synthase gamma chain n=1 Tax=Desulforudis audaxviator (strain MP104C) TaxID=477974 RepID=ATPG_DESAP|nr:ATP synthase F1 subunit gamma [Candidatus Desulforudis audaxviator]B1I6J8.1 RecName: Full=ATP synthase gamma chain; AltName: Full=ATP synthase F1 sector gamma subunit; AltName: Full=F-ATPase gamma subunit [Candidatus Desulforudis audaxviator MP104C]ACA60625.1 ATP synthase F1, gamma subunit [Candidatus Desulforudis audaxviator MP104C]AZK60708.1 ATP synthase gamma chain [Candidatus Desulforudis audaxviator]